jgi:hypothetical protein
MRDSFALCKEDLWKSCCHFDIGSHEVVFANVERRSHDSSSIEGYSPSSAPHPACASIRVSARGTRAVARPEAVGLAVTKEALRLLEDPAGGLSGSVSALPGRSILATGLDGSARSDALLNAAHSEPEQCNAA